MIYQRASEKSKIDRKCLDILVNAFLFILPTHLLLVDPNHFISEEETAVPLLTAKLAAEDRMFVLKREQVMLHSSVNLKGHITIILLMLKGLPISYTQYHAYLLLFSSI